MDSIGAVSVRYRSNICGSRQFGGWGGLLQRSLSGPYGGHRGSRSIIEALGGVVGGSGVGIENVRSRDAIGVLG